MSRDTRAPGLHAEGLRTAKPSTKRQTMMTAIAPEPKSHHLPIDIALLTEQALQRFLLQSWFGRVAANWRQLTSQLEGTG